MRTFLTVPALAVALVFGLTACGGSDSGKGASGASSPKADDNSMAVKFAKCMRDNGQQWEDPKPGQQQGIPMAAPGSKLDPGMQKALDACKQFMPNGGKPKPLSPEQQDKMLKMAQCLRKHGIDAPDPDSGKPMMIPREGGPGSEKFKKAMAACGQGAP